MKNRKQQFVVVGVFFLVLVLCIFALVKEMEVTALAAVPPTISTSPPEIIEPTATTNCQETKINYSDTIQVLVAPELKQKVEYLVSTYEKEIEMATKVMVAEAGSVKNASHRAAVVWCILNRVDASAHKSVQRIIVAPNQFAWYSNTSYTKEQYEFVRDIFARWLLEKEGFDEVGRTLPSDYRWFRGDGRENHFRNAYEGDYDVWDWSLIDPYI